MEEWRAVDDWPGYEVSNEGRVRSYRRHGRGGLASDPHMLTGWINRDGYVVVTLGGKQRFAHVLVLTAFVGLPGDGAQCRHLNGIPNDNRAVNLAWGTVIENDRDKDVHGTRARGERSGQAKVSNADVVAIRAMRAAGATLVTIGAKYGLTHSHVSQICQGKSRV